MPFEKYRLIPVAIHLFNVCFLISIGLDIKNQLLFTLKNSSPAVVCELDNVHLASVMKDQLKASGIDYCIQAYNFRRIYFFFEPFIKMKLLVSADNKDRASEILNSLEVKNI